MFADKLIEDIDSVSEVLARRVDYEGQLLELTEGLFPRIPDAALNILLYPDEIPGTVFFGYEALSEAEVVDFYKNHEDPIGFFSAYKYVSENRLTEDQAIYVDETAEGSLDEPDAIRDISTMLPLFRFQEHFAVCDFSERNKGALLDILHGHDAYFVAPGIAQHLEDLREGVVEGCYKVEEDGFPVYPWSSWRQRTGVRSGVLKMDENGDVWEPRSGLLGKILDKIAPRTG